jgi:CubicO group peptidase (beta-lactamase class C family)
VNHGPPQNRNRDFGRCWIPLPLGRLSGPIVCSLITLATLRADPIDDYVQAQLKKQHVPGASVAVVREGKIEKAKGYGLADVELNVPATERSVYQWGSITKQFTATAILLLAQENKLSLSDPISRYYPKAPPAWTNVTIGHLLTHTSGIKSYTSLPSFAKNLRKDYKPDELIGLVEDLPLDFSPGEKWDYSNTGYFLLGLVVEKASGESYASFLASRIFRLLGMETARVNDQFELIANRATGYEYRNNVLRRAEFASPTQPFAAGALVGTVLDLAKWDAALYTDKVLPSSFREEMWTPLKLNNGKTADYGYGWGLGEIRGHRFVGHGGGIPGFTTHILRLMQDKLTVIVLLNAGANPEAIARGIAGFYIPGLTLRTVTAQADTDPKLTESLKQCLIELAEKRDSPMLTPGFRANFSTSRARFAALKHDVPAMKSFTFILSEEPSDTDREAFGAQISRLSSFRMATGNENRFFTFGLTSDRKVAFYRASNE